MLKNNYWNITFEHMVKSCKKQANQSLILCQISNLLQQWTLKENLELSKSLAMILNKKHKI